MLFSTDAITGETIATLVKDGEPETWLCSLISCDNPVCTCSSIEIVLTPLQGGALDQQRLEIDLVEKKPVDDSKDSISPEHVEFSNRFQSRLTDDDYDFLSQKFLIYKQEITESADMCAVDIGFDYEAVEQNGLMYAYTDVLPYGRQMRVRINNEAYMILDQYCLLPKCPCTDTTLTITPLKDTDLVEAEAYVIRLRYDKKHWEIEESPPDGVTLKTLRSVIEEQIPDFYRQLKTRHEKMKALYLHNRQKNYYPPQVIKESKVGRNDPCPCGSGKKYKKCCL